MSILNEELDRIKKVMGIIKEEEQMGPSLDVNLDRIVLTLKFLKLYNPRMEKMLMDITDFAKKQVIDFGLLERGLRKRLLKKGDRKKNVEEYFGKVLTSLKYRDRGGYGTEPESEDYDFEIEEPSIIPKKIYRKELYDLQVELLKMQEWVKNTGKTVIVVFEGRDSAGKGSTIKKFTENLNPRYYNIIALGIPTPEDRKDWWNRYRSQIKPGMINLFQLSTGDLLRDEVSKKTEFGNKIEEIMKSGGLVSDEIINNLIENKISNPEYKNRIIFDGFPRNIEQAKSLDNLLKKYNQQMSLALNLKVDNQILRPFHYHDARLCLYVLLQRVQRLIFLGAYLVKHL